MTAIYTNGRIVDAADAEFLVDQSNTSGMPCLYECRYCKAPMQWFCCDGDCGSLCSDCWKLRSGAKELPQRLIDAGKTHPVLIAIPETDPTFGGHWLRHHGTRVDVSTAPKALRAEHI